MSLGTEHESRPSSSYGRWRLSVTASGAEATREGRHLDRAPQRGPVCINGCHDRGMAETNVELARRGYEAALRGDLRLSAASDGLNRQSVVELALAVAVDRRV